MDANSLRGDIHDLIVFLPLLVHSHLRLVLGVLRNAANAVEIPGTDAPVVSLCERGLEIAAAEAAPQALSRAGRTEEGCDVRRKGLGLGLWWLWLRHKERELGELHTSGDLFPAGPALPKPTAATQLGNGVLSMSVRVTEMETSGFLPSVCAQER